MEYILNIAFQTLAIATGISIFALMIVGVLVTIVKYIYAVKYSFKNCNLAGIVLGICVIIPCIVFVIFLILVAITIMKYSITQNTIFFID